jgi:uncharacterized protein
MTKTITKFSPDVIAKLQYYVYCLVDPRNNKVFYVGKGKGNRIFNHAEDTKKTKNEEDSLKIKIINEIQNKRKKVIQIIYHYGLCEATALELEAALINVYDPPANIRRSDISPLSVEQIQDTLEIKETAKFEHKVLIIKITLDSIKKQDNDIYEAARKAWVLNPKNADKAEYILAVCNGVIKEIFVLIGKWHKSSNEAGRYEFKGEPAPKDIQELYINKLIPPKYRAIGASNPIRYSWDIYNKKRGKK